MTFMKDVCCVCNHVRFGFCFFYIILLGLHGKKETTKLAYTENGLMHASPHSDAKKSSAFFRYPRTVSLL